MGNNIDKLFRDKLVDQPIMFNEEAWKGAKQLLNGNVSPTGEGRLWLNKWFLGLLVSIACMVVAYIYLPSNSLELDTTIVSKNESSIKYENNINTITDTIIMAKHNETLVKVNIKPKQLDEIKTKNKLIINKISEKELNENEESESFEEGINSNIYNLSTSSDLIKDNKDHLLFAENLLVDEKEFHFENSESNNNSIKTNQFDGSKQNDNDLLGYSKKQKTEHKNYSSYKEKNRILDSKNVSYVGRKHESKNRIKKKDSSIEEDLEDSFEQEESISKLNQTKSKSTFIDGDQDDENLLIENRVMNKKSTQRFDNNPVLKDDNSIVDNGNVLKSLNELNIPTQEDKSKNNKQLERPKLLTTQYSTLTSTEEKTIREQIKLTKKTSTALSEHKVKVNHSKKWNPFFQFGIGTNSSFEERNVYGGIGLDYKIYSNFSVSFGSNLRYTKQKTEEIVESVEYNSFSFTSTELLLTSQSKSFYQVDIPLLVNYKFSNTSIGIGGKISNSIASFGRIIDHDKALEHDAWLSLSNYQNKTKYYALLKIDYRLSKRVYLGMLGDYKMFSSINEEIKPESQLGINVFLKYDFN